MVGVGYADVRGSLGGDVCDNIVVDLAVIGIKPHIDGDIRVQLLKAVDSFLVYSGLGLVGIVLRPEGYLDRLAFIEAVGYPEGVALV